VLDLQSPFNEEGGIYNDEDGIRGSLEDLTDEIFGADVEGRPMWAR
jgi:hypothetical protein